VAQRTLSEMITYLGIIRTNVFNSLYTKVSTPQTLLNTLAMYKTFNSYETEFLLKASPLSVRSYNNKKKITGYGAVLNYLDNLFTKLKFDSTYSAEQWWDICTEGMRTLRKQQRD